MIIYCCRENKTSYIQPIITTVYFWWGNMGGIYILCYSTRADSKMYDKTKVGSLNSIHCYIVTQRGTCTWTGKCTVQVIYRTLLNKSRCLPSSILLTRETSKMKKHCWQCTACRIRCPLCLFKSIISWINKYFWQWLLRRGPDYYGLKNFQRPKLKVEMRCTGCDFLLMLYGGVHDWCLV